MPYINRNKSGSIIEIFDEASSDASEWVELSDPEVTSFVEKSLVSKEHAKEVLSNTDSDMVRVVEDLIDVLLDKQVFTFTELPEVVQNKLIARKKLRKDINSLENLIIDDELII